MVCLIDGDSLLFLSLPNKDEIKTVETCVEELKQRIENICKANNTEEYILCFTSYNNFRKKQWKYSKNYKGNRKDIKMPPTFKYLHEYALQNLGAFTSPGLEADDLISYFKKQFKDSVICSPDKDVLFQNIGMHYNYRTGEFINVDEEYSEYFLYKQIGMGDSGDYVSGIEGVGEKTVDKWFKAKKDKTYAQIILQEYINKYGVHEGINRFYECFSMVYLLNKEEEIIKETGYLPENPPINKIIYGDRKSVY